MLSDHSQDTLIIPELKSKVSTGLTNQTSALNSIFKKRRSFKVLVIEGMKIQGHWSCIWLKSTSSQKDVFLHVHWLWCLSFTVQNDVAAAFDTKRLFLWVHLESVLRFECDKKLWLVWCGNYIKCNDNELFSKTRPIDILNRNKIAHSLIEGGTEQM